MEVYIDTKNAFNPTKPNKKFPFKGRAIALIPPGHPILNMMANQDPDFDPNKWMAVAHPDDDETQMIQLLEMMFVPYDDAMQAALLN